MQQPDSPIIKDEFIIGTLVDMKITEPINIPNKFLLVDKVPSKSYAELTEAFFEVNESMFFNLNEEEGYKAAVLAAADKIDFQRKWKPETVFKNFKENCEDYVKVFLRAKAEEKTIYNAYHLAEAEELYQALINGEYTKSYFVESPTIKYFDQVELYWKFMDMEFKNKLDRVIVDTISKKIILADIKTYSGDFENSYNTYMYWLQAILYQVPLQMYKDTSKGLFPGEFELECSHPELLEYVSNEEYELPVGEFIFLTVDKSRKNPPIPFKTYINPTKTASGLTINDKHYEGWVTIAKLAWKHIQEDEWVYPMELKRKGFIEI